MPGVDIDVRGNTKPYLDAINRDVPAGAKQAAAAIARELAAASKKAAAALKSMGAVGLDVSSKLSAGALAAGGAYKALADDVYGTVREIDRLGTRTGLAADQVNALRLAAGASGQTLDDIVPEDLAVRIKEAAEGTGEGAAAFGLLGIKASDATGKLRTGADVFPELIDKLAELEDRTLAAALADDLFSDQGTNLIGVLAGGSAELDRFTRLSEEFGVGVGPEAAAAAAKWAEATSNVSLALEDGKQRLVEMNIAGQDATDWMNSFALGFIYLETLAVGAFDHMGEGLRGWRDLVRGDTTMEELTADLEASWDRMWSNAEDRARSFFENTGMAADEFVGPIKTWGDEVTTNTTKLLRAESDAKDAIAAANKEAAEQARIASEMDKVLGDWAAGLDALADIQAEAASDQLTDEGKIQLAYEERIDAISAAASATHDWDAANAAAAAAEERRQRDLLALQKERTDKLQQEIDALLPAAERVGEAMDAYRERYLEAIRDVVMGTITEAANVAFDVAQTLGEQELENDLAVLGKRQEAAEKYADRRKELREEIANAETAAQREELTAELERVKAAENAAKNEEIMARNAALKTFKDNQKLQVAQIGVNAAAAFGMTMATTPAPPPFNIAAAGTSAAAVLAQLADIRGATPPFHVGGVVRGGMVRGGAGDEVATTALDGEGYVSRRGMGGLGKEGLDRLNETGRLGPEEITTNTSIVLDGRVVARSSERHRRGRSRRNFHAERG